MPWSNREILELWIDLAGALSVPVDDVFGAAIWTVFSNNERVLDYNDSVVDVGSFRYAADLIASLVGGDYIQFYMSNYGVNERLVYQIREELLRRGFELIGWDEWERGVRAGVYPCPERWREYFERTKLQVPEEPSEDQ